MIIESKPLLLELHKALVNHEVKLAIDQIQPDVDRDEMEERIQNTKAMIRAATSEIQLIDKQENSDI